jgi:hypothetical protein
MSETTTPDEAQLQRWRDELMTWTGADILLLARVRGFSLRFGTEEEAIERILNTGGPYV